MTLKLTNNASSLLAGGIDEEDTDIAVSAGTGARFPSLTGDEWFPLVVVDADGGLEIMRATARAADVITVARGEENTEPRIFAPGARVELRLTRAALEAMPTLAPQLLARAGAVAAPAYSFAGDPNSGLYWIGADNIGLALNGTKVVDFLTTGLSITGAFAATGNFAIATNKFTVAAATGNTAIAGTLAVAGAAAFSAAVTVQSGGVTVTAGGVTVAAGGVTVAAGGLAVTGNSAITGTFAVSSTLTASNGFTVSAGAVSLPAASVADAALAAPGSWKLIATQTAAASPSISFDANTHVTAFNGTYDHIMIRLGNVKAATDNVTFDITIGTGAGPTFQSSGYQYAFDTGGPGGFGGNLSASNSKIPVIAGNNLGADAGEQVSGTIEFCNPEATDKMPLDVSLRYITTNGQPVTVKGVGIYGTAGAVTGIKFAMSSDNIASGTFAIYGLKKS